MVIGNSVTELEVERAHLSKARMLHDERIEERCRLLQARQVEVRPELRRCLSDAPNCLARRRQGAQRARREEGITGADAANAIPLNELHERRQWVRVFEQRQPTQAEPLAGAVEE